MHPGDKDLATVILMIVNDIAKKKFLILFFSPCLSDSDYSSDESDDSVGFMRGKQKTLASAKQHCATSINLVTCPLYYYFQSAAYILFIFVSHFPLAWFLGKSSGSSHL